jgi:hypothetical protein
MPFTNNPSGDTYSTQKIDLTREINLRTGSTTKDEDYVNVIIETIKDKELGDKRSALTMRDGTTSYLASVSAANIRGGIYWADQAKFLYVVGTTLYIYNITTGVTTTQVAFLTTTGDVGMVEYIYDDGTTSVVMSDGSRLAEYKSTAAWTVCADADLPTSFNPNIIFLDGYIFLVKTGTADIYCSDPNAPLSWTPGNFLNAEVEADAATRLAKINNYLVCFGTKTIEYFWDAGNATGSPLQRNDTPIKNITYLCGIAQEQNTVYFIGRNLGSGLQVFKMMDFKVEPISTPAIEKYLNSQTTAATWKGNIVTFQGRTFYVLNAGTRTYMCDIQATTLWTRLAYKAQTTFPLNICKMIQDVNGVTTCLFCLDDNTSTWYKWSPTTYSDSGTLFTCTIVTDPENFGTSRRKMMYNLFLDCDRPDTTSNIQVSWSDDDYQTFTTPVSVNLNQDLCCIRQLGSFRQRAFKLTYSDSKPFRIIGLEADINKGAS